MPTAITINTERIRKLADLVIPSGAAISNYLDADKLGNFDRIVITAPGTLTNVVKVVVGYDVADDSVFVVLQDPPGTDVAIAANKSVILPINLPAASLAVKAAGNELADRTFHVFGHIRQGIA